MIKDLWFSLSRFLALREDEFDKKNWAWVWNGCSWKGFVGIIDDKSQRRSKNRKRSNRISNEKIQSECDIVILDEINYAVNLNLISVDDVLNW